MSAASTSTTPAASDASDATMPSVEPPRKLPPWNETDIAALLTLDAAGEGGGVSRWVSRFGDANLNGRSYGGQSLGQALSAACMGVSPDRHPTLLQFLFLQGSMPDEPITFEVETLQEGSRFMSRHVRGWQGEGRRVLDAQVTFSSPLASPEHAAPFAHADEDPEALATLADVPDEWEPSLRGLGGYSLEQKPSTDFRVPDLHAQMAPYQGQPRFRFWLRARHPLPDSPGMHASAFAYLSDWWLNFAGLTLHRHLLDDTRRLYISSLNHSIWFHRPFSPGEWMHFDCHSPTAAGGRALSIAQVHDRSGCLVASATQECLMAYVRPVPPEAAPRSRPARRPP